jgi:hypothetical protein
MTEIYQMKDFCQPLAFVLENAKAGVSRKGADTQRGEKNLDRMNRMNRMEEHTRWRRVAGGLAALSSSRLQASGFAGDT